MPLSRLKLHGFNNLTKSLSCCIYNINFAKTAQHQKSYIDYVDAHYNVERLTEILNEVCQIIGANVLNIAQQRYAPQGASVTILVSEEETAQTLPFDKSEQPGPLPETVVAHLDKSHICVHTYPESDPCTGISTFRIDIEVSSCGVISPLKALNFIIHCFNADVLTLDYKVRGFTRDVHGNKHFIDHKINSIQHFLDRMTSEKYQMRDINLQQENLFHTKMMLKTFDLSKHIFNTALDDFSSTEKSDIRQKISHEMKELFCGQNLSRTSGLTEHESSNTLASEEL